MNIKTPVNGLSLIEHVLRYAGLGWPVFRLTGYKTPLKGSHGFKDATVDEKVIRKWWQGGGPNIGLATGCKINGRWLVVIDADGAGLSELLMLAKPHGGLPRTLAARTSNGWHFYFWSRVELRSQNAKRERKGGPGIDLKGVGGYVVLPPSVNARTGFVYQWANWETEPADMPEWLEAYWLGRTGKRREVMRHTKLGTFPTDTAKPGPSRMVGRALTLMRQAEFPDLVQALRGVDAACGYDDWFAVGAGIYSWDSGPNGLALFKAWSRSAAGYREDVEAGACERKWIEYGKPAFGGQERARITTATIYHKARKDAHERADVARGGNGAGNLEAGAGSGGAAPDIRQMSVEGSGAAPGDNVGAGNGHVNGGMNGHHAAAFMTPDVGRLHFIDTDDHGNPRATATNSGIAIRKLGVTCELDTFHDKMLVGGEAIAQWAGDLSDNAVLMLRKMIKSRFGFDPGSNHCRDAAVQLCLENQYDPVGEYLDECQRRWDGVGRIGRWVVDHLGADENELNCEFGRLFLIAAARRVRAPGSKFDHIIVFEGKEGTNKSTALRVLAGGENFSDQNILTGSDREQQEAVCGVWIYEISELQGMRRAEIERVKQFASRLEDRARPAYGRIRVDRPRRVIFAGTTNKDTYLQSETGNRRFWPVKTGYIDIDRLQADRDQLWGEAAYQESKGAGIGLAPRFWEAATEMQEVRREADTWAERVGVFLNKLEKPETSVSDILSLGLQVDFRDMDQIKQNRIARILKDNKWERFRKREGNSFYWKYRK